MDSVEYTRGSQTLEVETSAVTTFVSQTLKNFADVKTPHCIAVSRKHTAYNKLPGTVKFFHRISQKNVDLPFDAAVLDIVPLHVDCDCFAVVTVDGRVTLVKVSDMPDASVAAEILETYTVEGAAKVAISQRVGVPHKPTDPRAGKQMFVFCSNGKLAVVAKLDQAGATPAVSAIEGADKGDCPRSVCSANGLVAYTLGKEVRLAMCEKAGGGSLLGKPWTPHGEPVDFVRVLGRACPTGVFVVTSAGAEVRFWTVSEAGAKLHQTAELAGPAPAGAVFKAVDMDEDFLFVVDGAAGRAVVFEFTPAEAAAAASSSSVAFGASRITEWGTGAEEMVSVAPIYRKVTAAPGAPLRHEMTIIARTASGVKRFGLDAARLNGPEQLAASQSQSQGPSSVASPAELKKRYGLDKPSPAVAAAGGAASAPSPMAPTGFTQITSIMGGQTTTKSSVDPRVMQEALVEQQRAFSAILGAIDQATVQLQRTASEALGSRASQASASAAGEASAKSVAASIFGNLPAGGAAGAGGASYDGVAPINKDVFDGFMAAIMECATLTVATTFDKTLKHHASNAIDRLTTVMQNQAEKDGQAGGNTAALLKAATPSMESVKIAVDKAHQAQNDLFKRQKEQDLTKYKSIVNKLTSSSKTTNAEGAKYLAALTAEIAALRAEVATAGALPAAPADATESEEQLFTSAIKLADSGEWAQALLKVTGAGKQALTMRFLETDMIRVNAESVTAAAGSSVPLFVALAQQLSTGLAANPGAMPARVEWLHGATLAFDEMATSEALDKKTQDQLKAAQVHISNIADNVAEAEGQRDAVDRATRRHLKIIGKALAMHGL